MKYSGMFALAALGGLLFSMSGVAQEEKEKAPQICKASDLMGMDVKNRKGETIGDIEDIVIDARTGEVVYVALAHGETLDLGGKFFAIPPQSLTINPEFVGLDIDQAKLQRAKGFNKEAWPETADTSLVSDKPQERDRDSKERTVVRVSQLMDADIYGRDNKKLGEVDGIALDKSRHKVAYVVLGYGGLADIGEEFFAISYEALTYKPQNRTLTLNATEADFEGKKGFNKDNWPTQPDQRFKKSDSEDRN